MLNKLSKSAHMVLLASMLGLGLVDTSYAAGTSHGQNQMTKIAASVLGNIKTASWISDVKYWLSGNS